MYPNPSNGEFAVALNGFHGTTELEVYNIVGNLVWSAQVQGAQPCRTSTSAIWRRATTCCVCPTKETKSRRVTLLD